MSNTAHPGATYDATTPSVVITDLTITHPAVTSEALRWSTGTRGPAEAAEKVDGADLTAYAEQALVIGAQAIAAAGGTQDTFNLEQLVQDVGRRTSESTALAAESTTKVVGEAAKVMKDASDEARKALHEEGERARNAFGESVAHAQKSLTDQVQHLVGGNDPELVARLKTLVTEFAAALNERADKHAADLYDKATRALNPDDPTSPLAKHQAHISQQHKQLAEHIDRQHSTLAKSVGELATAVKVQQEAAKVSAKLASVTTLKGFTFEEKVNELMAQIAVGLGDEYLVTGHKGGSISGYNKKGDGALVIAGGLARVVLEMSDSARTDWNDYLAEAERNRQAQAALGLVPTPDQNGGQGLRMLGPRRLVLAFDPESDASLLRTAVQLLRVSALTASARQDDGGVAVARERIDEALTTLAKVDRIRKAAGGIRKGANDIDAEADKVQTTLNRLLLQAQTAIAGSALSVVEEADVESRGAQDSGVA